MRQNLFRTFALAGVFALLASAGLAQQTPAQQTQPSGKPDGAHDMGRHGGRRHMGREGRGGGHKGPGGERRVLGRLNLSDAQREGLRGIESRYAEGFRTKREELRGIMQTRRGGGTLTAEQEARARALRDEMHAGSGKMRDEIRALLTDEQRTQLQSTRDEMRQRREERRGMRGERREQRGGERRRERNTTPPANPPGQ